MKEESGVKEYWVVHPDEHILLIDSLEEGKYISSRLFTHCDVVHSNCIPGFALDLEEVFGKLD